jgi:hypothetical protein
MEHTNGQRPELYIAIISLLLSLAAFSTSVIQTNIMQKQQKASVWPHLEVSSGVISGAYYIKVKNKGVGPAIVKNVAFNAGGKSYVTAMECAKAILQDTSFHEWYFSSFPINKSVFASNEEVETIKINDVKFIQALFEKGKDFNFKIRYASVYGEEWETDGSNTVQVKY